MELNYVKRPENSLLSELNEIVDLEEAQNYIPIYGKFFNLTEGNYNMIQLNNSQYLSNIESKVSDNIYKAKVKTLNNDERREEVFFKFCPLMDPVKYMIGKFDLSKNITVIKNPPREDVISAYGESEFLILPSQW